MNKDITYCFLLEPRTEQCETCVRYFDPINTLMLPNGISKLSFIEPEIKDNECEDYWEKQ